MGTIRDFECPSCYGTWRIRVGHGMMHGSLNHVLKAFPPDIQKKILTDIDGEPDPFFNFNYQAAACLQCGEIIAVPVLYLHKTECSYVSGCPECGSLELMPEEDSNFQCPRCNNKQLSVQVIGSWD